MKRRLHDSLRAKKTTLASPNHIDSFFGGYCIYDILYFSGDEMLPMIVSETSPHDYIDPHHVQLSLTTILSPRNQLDWKRGTTEMEVG